MATCDINTINAQACANKFLCGQSEQQLLVLIAQLLCNINEDGGIGGGGQIRYYTTDPNTESVVPDDQTLPGLAYSLDGSGSIYGWNPNTLLWV